jgi:proteasome accessory factor A
VKRGLFNLRDEPHASRALYWRFHDINWEGIRSDVQIYMRDLLQTFVMAAFEKGYLQDPPILRDPLGDMKQLSLDLELDWKVTLLDGRRVDAVKDILIGYYLKRIETMLEREKACDEDWTAFTRLSQLLGVVAERDLSRLAYCLDWVTKFGLVQACEDTNEGLAACNQFCLIDGSILNYTGEKDPTQGDSLFEPKESISKMLNWVPEATPEKIQDDVRQSRFRPPASTRESKRVQALVEKSSEDLEANWSFVAGKQGWERNFPDPLG